MLMILASQEIGQEDHSLKPAQTNSLKDPISKIPIQKRAGRVVQVVELLPSKSKALSSKLQYNQKQN
jgi:hypothetical protein